MYRTLDASKVVSTLKILESRISERFPGARLAAVCSELIVVTEQAQDRAESIARPDWRLRGIVGLIMASGVALLATLTTLVLSTTNASHDLFETLQGVDSAFNIVVLMGAALLLMARLEDRRKRMRALSALHELRSIIHVIDMHQLTKDPNAGVATSRPTASSPKRPLTPQQVVRYLDYCSEMLALTSKVGAIYAQSYPDPVVTEAVTDLERTATGLSQKIWQKINIIHRDLDSVPAAPFVPGE